MYGQVQKALVKQGYAWMGSESPSKTRIYGEVQKALVKQGYVWIGSKTPSTARIYMNRSGMPQ